MSLGGRLTGRLSAGPLAVWAAMPTTPMQDDTGGGGRGEGEGEVD